MISKISFEKKGVATRRFRNDPKEQLTGEGRRSTTWRRRRKARPPQRSKGGKQHRSHCARERATPPKRAREERSTKKEGGQHKETQKRGTQPLGGTASPSYSCVCEEGGGEEGMLDFSRFQM